MYKENRGASQKLSGFLVCLLSVECGYMDLPPPPCDLPEELVCVEEPPPEDSLGLATRDTVRYRKISRASVMFTLFPLM